MKGIVFPSASRRRGRPDLRLRQAAGLGDAPDLGLPFKDNFARLAHHPVAPKIGLGTSCQPVASYDRTWIIDGCRNRDKRLEQPLAAYCTIVGIDGEIDRITLSNRTAATAVGFSIKNDRGER